MQIPQARILKLLWWIKLSKISPFKWYQEFSLNIKGSTSSPQVNIGPNTKTILAIAKTKPVLEIIYIWVPFLHLFACMHINKILPGVKLQVDQNKFDLILNCDLLNLVVIILNHTSCFRLQLGKLQSGVSVKLRNTPIKASWQRAWPLKH